MEIAVPQKPSILQRINFRVVIFVIAVGGLLAVIPYLYLSQMLTGGIVMRADGLIEVNLKAMSTFDFDQANGKIDDVPKKFRDLDGKKITFVGEIAPPKDTSSGELKKFEIVYSVSKCCYGGLPLIQHFVQSVPANGSPLPFYYGPVRVIGTLKVDVTKDPETGNINGIYHVAVDKMTPM